MKIKKIKKILIGEIEFSIFWDKTTSGGSFNLRKKEIMIGTELGELRAFSVLIHELKEVIQTNQSARYESVSCNDDFIFVYNHAQHTDFCERLAGLLSLFLE